MDIKRIAETFGMTVDEFARCIGYSRQALYHKDIKNKARFRAAINGLRFKSQNLFDVDQKRAALRFEARNAAIKEFERLMLKDGEGNV